MSNRTIRVNELVKREISDILHVAFRTEAVGITVLDVRVSPDLREGRVFVSIVGDEEHAQDSLRWLRGQAGLLRRELGKRIVLKYLPKLHYELDHSVERGTRIVRLLDELDEKDGDS